MDHAQVARSNSGIPMLPSPCQSRKLDANMGTSTSEAQIIERDSISTYHPPLTTPPPKPVDWVYNPADGSVLLDHKGRPLSVDKILATKPLRGELSTRPGPGGKKLTYISGDGVTRTLNDIFGFDGWNLDITKVEKVDSSKDSTGKYTIVYTAMVRVTHKASGTYKEDCGAGDSTDRCLATAISHALKASVTDAMKRAARHFGDKLGNSLYQGSFSINKAPVTLKDALEKYDVERANSKFGFGKNMKQKNTSDTQRPSNLNVVATGKENRTGVISVQTNGGTKNCPLLPHNNLAPFRHPLPVSEMRGDRDISVKNKEYHPPGLTSASTPLEPVKHSLSTRSENHLGAPLLQQSRQKHDAMPPPQTHAAVPPQTPMDALRNSSLFGYGIQSEYIDNGMGSNRNPYGKIEQSSSVCTMDLQSIPCPPSTNGRRIAHPGPNATLPHGNHTSTKSTPPNDHDSSKHRRISIGDAFPTQPAPLVTPNENNAAQLRSFRQQSPNPSISASSTSSCSLLTVHKRPATAFLHNENHRQTKRIAAASQNPYSTNLIAAKKK